MHFEVREMPMTCCCESFDDLFKEKTFNEEQEEKFGTSLMEQAAELEDIHILFSQSQLIIMNTIFYYYN